MCQCACVHVCVYVCVCVCVCIHIGGQRSVSGVPPQELSIWILETWILPLRLSPSCLHLPSWDYRHEPLSAFPFPRVLGIELRFFFFFFFFLFLFKFFAGGVQKAAQPKDICLGCSLACIALDPVHSVDILCVSLSRKTSKAPCPALPQM